MQKLILLCGVFFFGAHGLHAQANPSIPPKIHGSLYRLPLREKAYRPSANMPELYIHNRWSMGSFTTLAGDTYGDFPLRFDLLGNMLEILISGGIIKVLPLTELQGFTWVYPNTREWEKYQSSLAFRNVAQEEPGVMRVLYEGAYQLLAFHRVKLIPAFYIPQLDAGHREDTYQLEMDYFLASPRDILTRIPRKPSQAWEIFSPYEREVRRFVKKEYLSFKYEEDLIRIATEFEKYASP